MIDVNLMLIWFDQNKSLWSKFISKIIITSGNRHNQLGDTMIGYHRYSGLYM